MSEEQPNNPLHGITLKMILEDLVARHGWEGLAERIKLGCFQNKPTINSSLKLLRRNEWARTKVERLYLRDHKEARRRARKKANRAARGASPPLPEDSEPGA